MSNPYRLCKNIQKQRVHCVDLEENLVAEVEKTHLKNKEDLRYDN